MLCVGAFGCTMCVVCVVCACATYLLPLAAQTCPKVNAFFFNVPYAQ